MLVVEVQERRTKAGQGEVGEQNNGTEEGEQNNGTAVLGASINAIVLVSPSVSLAASVKDLMDAPLCSPICESSEDCKCGLPCVDGVCLPHVAGKPCQASCECAPFTEKCIEGALCAGLRQEWWLFLHERRRL